MWTTVWCCVYVFLIIVDQGIDIEAFDGLNNDFIKELIPTLGDRIKFTKHFSTYKQPDPVVLNISNTSNLNDAILDTVGEAVSSSPCTSTITASSAISPASSFMSDFIEDRPLEIVPVPLKSQLAFCLKRKEDFYEEGESLTYDFDLKSFLECSSEGREILNAAGKFTPFLRNKLTDLIIRNELKNDETKQIPTERFIQLARLIKQLFPTENIATYYSPYVSEAKGKQRRCARGKLFDKYHNRKRSMRTTGLLATKKSKVDNEETSNIDINIPEEITELVKWLENCSEPWVDVFEKWNQTYEIRQNILQKCVNIQDYFDQFPCLRQPLGYTLIEQDFKIFNPECQNKAFIKIPDLVKIIIEKAKTKTKDVHINTLLSKNNSIKNIDHEIALGLLLLPLLFTKTNFIRPKGKSKAWRPSKIEVQQSFIAHLNSMVEIKPFLERRQNKYKQLKETCQPVIVIVGSLIEYEVLLSINSILYKVGNLLKTLDVTFKMFHVLSLKYPVESEHVWLYIQKYVYELTTPFDKSFVIVDELGSELILS